jgi:hypothetical protein
MIIASSIVTAAKAHGVKTLAQSTVPGERFTQVDAVVDLLAGSTSPLAQPGARKLLREMSVNEWSVIRGVHPSPDDPTPHILLLVDDVRYHLRVDAKDCIFDITCREAGQTVRPSGSKPWVSPGS